MLDQSGIIQNIVDQILSVIEPGWVELIVEYQVEGTISGFSGSYLINEGGAAKEKAIPYEDQTDVAFRQLHDHLALGGKQPFTTCRLPLWADGRFNIDYGYEKIDWDPAHSSDWYFFPTRK